MARRVSRESREQKLMQVWWVRIILAFVFIGLGYGFTSLALDSGNLFQYGIALVFFYWAVAHTYRGLRYGLVAR